MFRGANALNLDAKGRLAVPARHRARLQERGQDQVVVTVDPEHCLLIYPMDDWVEIERQLMRLPGLRPDVRKLRGLLLGNAMECELDGQGRILVPAQLRDYARLDKRVMLVGQGNKFELWDEAVWNERQAGWLAEGLGDMELSAGLETLPL